MSKIEGFLLIPIWEENKWKINKSYKSIIPNFGINILTSIPITQKVLGEHIVKIFKCETFEKDVIKFREFENSDGNIISSDFAEGKTDFSLKWSEVYNYNYS